MGAMARRCAPLAVVAAAAAAAAATAESVADTCLAGRPCAHEYSATEPGSATYHWPRARGHVGSYSRTNHTLPWDLNASFAWKWNHPDGQYATITVGVVIDDETNIYLSAQDAFRKFSPDGRILWEYKLNWPFTYHNPSLMDGLLFASSNDGFLFALNMSTGREVWKRKHAETKGYDTGYVEAYQGLVLAAFDRADQDGGDARVIAVKAQSGEKLWEVRVSPRVWNFMALYPGDETVLFMDYTGGVLRLHLENGTQLWHAKSPWETSMTDGGMVLGPDGTAYACSNVKSGGLGTRGMLRAYRLSDGEVVWSQELDLPCTSWPVATDKAVVVPVSAFLGVPFVLAMTRWLPWLSAETRGLLHRLSLSLGTKINWLLPSWLGAPTHPRTPSEILAFEPKTGHILWRYRAPDFDRMDPLGDEEGIGDRVRVSPDRLICLPAMWASPTMSGDGVTYVARSDGWLYAVRDKNGDGVVEGPSEVATFWTGGGALHPGPAFAPGLMAVATCDTLFVFRRP